MKDRIKNAMDFISRAMLIGAIAALIVFDDPYDIVNAMRAYMLGVVIGNVAWNTSDIIRDEINSRKTMV